MVFHNDAKNFFVRILSDFWQKMSKKTCSNCGYIYWVNVQMDNEYACSNCGYVENERIIGQLKGRRAIADE